MLGSTYPNCVVCMSFPQFRAYFTILEFWMTIVVVCDLCVWNGEITTNGLINNITWTVMKHRQWVLICYSSALFAQFWIIPPMNRSRSVRECVTVTNQTTPDIYIKKTFGLFFFSSYSKHFYRIRVSYYTHSSHSNRYE